MIEKEIKMQSFRFSTSAVEGFRRYCEENRINQAEGFELLLKNAELEKAKTAFPDRKAEIENVQTHANALISAYIQSLDIYASASERAEAAIADKIDKKEKRIAALEEEKENLKNTLCEKTTKIEELEKTINESAEQAKALSETHQNTLNALKDKDKIIASLEQETAKCVAIKTEYECLQNKSIELIQKLSDAENHIKELKVQKDDSDRIISEIEHSCQNTISYLEAQHKNALQATENEKERAVLDAKSEFQKRLEEYTAKYEQKLEELEKRNKELLVLTERNSKLSKELSKLKKKDIIYDIDETSDDDVWEV